MVSLAAKIQFVLLKPRILFRSAGEGNHGHKHLSREKNHPYIQQEMTILRLGIRSDEKRAGPQGTAIFLSVSI